jgi:hypothetical protein
MKPIVQKSATLAVEVTDMLGEEVLVLSRVEGLVVKEVEDRR